MTEPMRTDGEPMIGFGLRLWFPLVTPSEPMEPIEYQKSSTDHCELWGIYRRTSVHRFIGSDADECLPPCASTEGYRQGGEGRGFRLPFSPPRDPNGHVERDEPS